MVKHYILFLLIGLMASSCSLYKQDILFKTEGSSYKSLNPAIAEAERNYTIKPDDRIQIDVFTDNGERIIDPNFQLLKELGLNQNIGQRPAPEYLVMPDSTVRLPMIGSITLAGLTLQEADLVLQAAYSDFYTNPYVLTQYVNKRVIVLGATEAQVIPLQNQYTSVLEVLALAGGITTRGKAHNIRLIRGNLDDPEVQEIDLSTINGMKNASLQVLPGDIIYVEPIRRVLPETIRDIAPIVGILTNVVTLTIVIINLNNN